MTVPPAAVPAQPPARRRGPAFWLAIVFAVVAGISLLVNCLLMVLTAALALGAGSGELIEEVVESGDSTQRIAVIPITGIISDQPTPSLFGAGTSLVESVTARLRRAAEDDSVVAVVLLIDTPGGGVTASDRLHHEVVELGATGKPVVVHMGDLCCSGGIYVAAAADHLIASPTTITGSIGVMLGHVDLTGLLNIRLGVEVDPITSGPYKDAGTMTRAMTPEERLIFQTLVDELHGRFVDLLSRGRAGHGPVPAGPGAARAHIATLADGRIYSASQAQTTGLVDAIGYREDAIAEARHLGGAAQAEVIRYRGMGDWGGVTVQQAGGLPGVALEGTGSAAEAVGRLLPSGARFWYLWQPGL